MSQFDTKIGQNNPKNFHFFKKISCFFPKFLVNVVNWNVENRQQGKSVLPSMHKKIERR